MRPEELKEALEAQGYKSYPPPEYDRADGIEDALQRKLGATVCLTNGEASINVTIRAPIRGLGGKIILPATVDFRVIGEYADGMWCDLRIYGIRLDQALEQERLARIGLTAAYRALSTRTKEERALPSTNMQKALDDALERVGMPKLSLDPEKKP